MPRKSPTRPHRLLALLLPLTFACAGGDAGEEMEAEMASDAATAAEAEATTDAATGSQAEEMAPAPEGVITDLREIEFAAELGVDLDAMEERESGLFVQVLEPGSGPPAGYGDTMEIHYTLWLPNGTKIHSSRDGPSPTPSHDVLGVSGRIAGWVEGVTGMRHGERRRLVLPYHLGYGPEGWEGAIPGYTPLVFEVELAEHVPTGEG